MPSFDDVSKFFQQVVPLLAPLALTVSLTTLALTQRDRRRARHTEAERERLEADRVLQQFSEPGIAFGTPERAVLLDARMHATRAHELSGGSEQTQVTLATCEWLLGDDRAAEEVLRRIARSNPGMHRAHCQLAILYLRSDRLDLAEPSVHAAIETGPTCTTATACLGELRFRQKRYMEAVAVWRDALASRPRDGVVHANLGAALADGGQHEEAVDQFSLALKYGLRHATVYRNLGKVLVRLGQRERAESMFEVAVQRDPTDVVSLEVLGLMRQADQDEDGAASYFNRVLAIDPTSADALQWVRRASEQEELRGLLDDILGDSST